MDGAQKGTVVNGKPVVYSDAGQIKATTLDITKDDASNNNVLYIMTVQRLTSGTPGNGIGVGVDFQTENSNNVVTQIGTVEIIRVISIVVCIDGVLSCNNIVIVCTYINI